MVRIMSLKEEKFFSVQSSPDQPIFKKTTLRSSPDLAKIDLSADLCSYLLRARTIKVENAFVKNLDINNLESNLLSK